MYKAIVIGVSMGGLDALMHIVPKFAVNFPVPVIIVQHLPEGKKNSLAKILNACSNISVEEAQEKGTIECSTVYIAPSGYHLLIEEDYTFSLDEGGYVNYSRPSVDVLFESAANVYTNELIGLILTGANNDGSQGLKTVKARGGLALVQDPGTAASKEMILAAMQVVKVDQVVELENMASYLTKLIEVR